MSNMEGSLKLMAFLLENRIEKPRFRWIHKGGDVYGWVAVNKSAVEWATRTHKDRIARL